MRIVIAGAHGQIARRLGRLLSARGDTVVGIVRNPDHAADLIADGVEPAVLDLESASVDAGRRGGRGRRRRRLRRRAPARAAATRPQGHRRPRCRGPAGRRRRAGRRAAVPAGLVDGRRAVRRRGRRPRAWTTSSPSTCRPSCAAEDEVLPRPGAGPRRSLRPGAAHRRPGHRPGHASARPWARAASPATTSPPCCSPCSTPAATAPCWSSSAATPRSREAVAAPSP